MVAAAARGGAWKIPALGLGVVGLGLIVSLRLLGSPSQLSGSGPSASASAEQVTALEIRGLRAELIDGERPSGSGELAWWTTWRLCWSPVPGAQDYLVTTVSFEGPGIPQPVSGTCHELSVASGTTRESGNYAGRDAQLVQMEVSMSVGVAARMTDGTIGPESPDISVGEAYP